jgi:hypothetical protein
VGVLVVDGKRRFDQDVAAGEAFVIRGPHERAIESRRGDAEFVEIAVGCEGIVEVRGDALAGADVEPAFAIDYERELVGATVLARAPFDDLDLAIRRIVRERVDAAFEFLLKIGAVYPRVPPGFVLTNLLQRRLLFDYGSCPLQQKSAGTAHASYNYSTEMIPRSGTGKQSEFLSVMAIPTSNLIDLPLL